MGIRKYIYIIIVFIAINTQYSGGDLLLGTIDDGVRIQCSNIEDEDSFPTVVGLGYVEGCCFPHTVLFWDISTQNIGQTLYIGPLDDSDFDLMATYFTNGINDVLVTDIRGSCMGFYDFLIGGSPDSDFIDYEITRFGVTVNTLTFETPGTNPSGTDYTLDVTFSVHGNVIPEPATLSLLLVGGLTLARRRR